MIQLSPFGERVIDRINMIGMWVAVTISVRNFIICLRQYRRTHGLIHLMNMGQVTILIIHRFVYGLVPLFEITTCAFWPLLVSLWHLNFVLMYCIMFKRLLILEADKRTFWIKIAGALLITLRFADWPYELAFHTLQLELMQQHVQSGSNCLAQWGSGVILLNFIADALANLFLSGMFVRRLYMHIRSSRTLMSHRSQVIEYIARKSLVCLILTFVVNLTMNLLKITRFIGNRSDAFTVYFEIIESTLLVEALRVDHTQLPEQSFCEHCGMIMTSYGKEQRRSPVNRTSKKQQVSDIDHVHIPSRTSYHNSSAYTDIQLMSVAEQHESRNYTSRNV